MQGLKLVLAKLLNAGGSSMQTQWVELDVHLPLAECNGGAMVQPLPNHNNIPISKYNPTH